MIGNLVGALQPVPRLIQLRQIGHFHLADAAYGAAVAAGLGIAMQEVLQIG